MDIGKPQREAFAIPRKGSIPGLPDEGVSAYPIYLLIERDTVEPDRVLSVHLNEQGAWDAIARLDPEDIRSFSVASYDPTDADPKVGPA